MVYPPPAFHVESKEAAYAHIVAHPLAMLAVNGPSGPLVTHVPCVLNADKTALLGHLARQNGLVKVLASGPVDAAAIFNGPAAYISPNWYASKAEHGRVVPTWNYVSVEVRGRLKLDDTPEAMPTYFDALTEQMEANEAIPWAPSDAPRGYTEKLSRAIVGIELDVRAVTTIRKLSQNKSDADRSSVIYGLQATGHLHSAALAQEMLREEASR